MESRSVVRDFSKYFTPPLTSGDRVRLERSLLLGAMPWALEESCGGQVLRRWSSEEGPIWDKPEATSTEFDFAVMGPQLHCSPFRETRDLWRELLSHPYRSVPNDAPEARLLGEAWASTEAALSAFELSLVWAGSSGSGIPLLFHFVRRRCIRLGTTESLEEIGQKCLSGEWDSNALQAHFGTRTGFFHWQGAEPAAHLSVHPLARLAEILRNALPATVSGAIALPDRPQTRL